MFTETNFSTARIVGAGACVCCGFRFVWFRQVRSPLVHHCPNTSLHLLSGEPGIDAPSLAAARAVGSDAGLRRTGPLGPSPSAPTCVHAGCSHEGPFSVRREHVHPSPGGWRPGTSGQVSLHLTAGRCGSEARPARLRARLEVTVTLATPTLAPQRVCLGEGHQFMVRALPLTLGLISMAGNI